MKIKYEKIPKTDPAYEKGWRWRLLEDITLKMDNLAPVEHDYFIISDQGNITLFKGYAIDGVTAFPDVRCLVSGAFAHDPPLQAMGDGLISEEYRPNTHKWFYEYCDKSKWYKNWISWVAYKGLKLLHPLWHKVTG